MCNCNKCYANSKKNDCVIYGHKKPDGDCSYFKYQKNVDLELMEKSNNSVIVEDSKIYTKKSNGNTIITENKERYVEKK